MKKLTMLMLFLVGCTDARWSQLNALGEPGTITCFSGGVEIYKGKSTGKIATESESDGWYFTDAATGRLVRISGDCVVRN